MATDVDVSQKFALWLLVSMLASFAIVYGVFWFFEGREKAYNAAIQRYPLAVAVPHKDPPGPNLQMQPFKDLFEMRQGENDRLAQYGWVDKEGGVARIPIDRAMEVMLQRGFPTRAEGGDALNVVSQDSSSGRTTAPR